jgi:hypothetical protein
MSLPAKSYDFVFHPHINRLFQQRIEQIKQIRLFEINERQRSPNQTNLANTCSMFMPIDLFHWQNACVHCFIYFIRYICYICC